MIDVSYEWFVDQMLVKKVAAEHKNVVCLIIWRCVGTQGETTGTQFGEVELANFGGGEFTPYEHLTQDQVLSWCFASGLDRAFVEAAVAEEIKDKLFPEIVALPNPWN
jgi:hypothetical protein